MRVYIIGNDGIILCREAPAAMNEGEIVVASNEELHAAQLSGKRLLALWNALPDIEKRGRRDPAQGGDALNGADDERSQAAGRAGARPGRSSRGGVIRAST
jgi:hypothetical protein